MIRALRFAGYLFPLAVVAFLLSPLIIVIILSFSANDYIAFPPDGYSLRWYEALSSDRDMLLSTILSLKIALYATGIGILVGTPTALLLTQYRLRGLQTLRVVALSPLILPEVLLGLALLVFVMRTLVADPNQFWLTVGHAIIVLPFCVQFISASLAKLNPDIVEAARTLGASSWRAFWRITIPCVRPGLVSAALMSFIFSFDNVAISLFMSGPGRTTLPVRMYEHATYSNDLSMAAISAVLIYLGVAFVFLLGLVRGFDGVTTSTR